MQLRTPSSDQPGQQPGTSHDAFVLEPPSSRLAISSPPAGLRSSSSAPGPDLAPSSRLHALPPLDTPISYEVVSYTSTPVESSLSGALGDNTVYFTTPSIIRVSIPIATYTPPLHRLYPPRDLRTPSALSPLATTVAPPAWYHSPRLTIEHPVYHTPPFHRIHPSYYWPSLSQDSSYAHPLPPPLHIHDLYSNDPTTVSHAYYPPSFSLSPYFERQHTPAASRPQPLPIARTSSTGPSLQLIDIVTQLPASSFPAIRFHSTSSGLSQPSYAVPATPVRHAPVDEALTVPPLTSTELNPTTAAWPVRRQQRSARNAWTCTFCSSQFPDEDSLDQHRQMHARQQGTLNMTEEGAQPSSTAPVRKKRRKREDDNESSTGSSRKRRRRSNANTDRPREGAQEVPQQPPASAPHPLLPSTSSQGGSSQTWRAHEAIYRPFKMPDK